MAIRVGCCIAHANRVVSTGHNHSIGTNFPSNTSDGAPQASYHAEMHAIENLLRMHGLLNRARNIFRLKRAFPGFTLARSACDTTSRRCAVDIYTARYMYKTCRCGLARPCCECVFWMEICEHLGIHIRHVYFTDETGVFIESSLHDVILNSHTFKAKVKIW